MFSIKKEEFKGYYPKHYDEESDVMELERIVFHFSKERLFAFLKYLETYNINLVKTEPVPENTRLVGLLKIDLKYVGHIEFIEYFKDFYLLILYPREFPKDCNFPSFIIGNNDIYDISPARDKFYYAFPWEFKGKIIDVYYKSSAENNSTEDVVIVDMKIDFKEKDSFISLITKKFQTYNCPPQVIYGKHPLDDDITIKNYYDDVLAIMNLDGDKWKVKLFLHNFQNNFQIKSGKEIVINYRKE